MYNEKDFMLQIQYKSVKKSISHEMQTQLAGIVVYSS